MNEKDNWKLEQAKQAANDLRKGTTTNSVTNSAPSMPQQTINQATSELELRLEDLDNLKEHAEKLLFSLGVREVGDREDKGKEGRLPQSIPGRLFTINNGIQEKINLIGDVIEKALEIIGEQE